MGDPNGAVSITNTSVTIVDHYSGSYYGQTSEPSAQGKSVIRLQYDQYNRNSDIMVENSYECNPMTPTTAQPTSRDRESQFSTTSADTTGSTSNGSGNALDVGRGKHRLRQKRSATRVDHSANVCLSVAAPVVPVCERQASNSAFDNKAFSSDGDSVGPQLQTQNISPISVTSNHRIFELNSQLSTQLSSQLSTNTSITDRLINEDNNIDCLKSGAKEKNCFMKTNNESESTLKGQQYCSSGDANRHIIRSRSTRSSVVKHIGVFYSDLCDVIKAMRSGTQTNSNNNNNNNNNCNNNNTSNPSNGSNSCATHPQQTIAANARTNISGPVLLQNEHLMSNVPPVPVPPQQQQQQPLQRTTSSPYPIQPQLQAITCLQSSPITLHLMTGNTTLRNGSLQSQVRPNEAPPVHDLPDIILNSHLPPPPYSTLPPSGVQHPAISSQPPLVERGRNTPIRAPPPPPPPPPLPVAGRPPLPSRRLLHAPTAVLAHCSRPNYLRPTCAVSETETSTSKACLSCNGVSIRWFILLIAFIGLLCAIIGTILGALRTTGREHLTLALLMIGVGIILITVSGVAWRLTSSGPTWRSILGIHELHPQQSLCNGSTLNDTARRFVPRVPAPYGRTGTHHHPYGAMFYPEFQYRPPPPSYQASMQEYRLRLLLLDRSSSHPHSTSLSPVSPPPTYRSSAASSVIDCNTIIRASSRPPSYRVGERVVSSVPSNSIQTSQSLPQTTMAAITNGMASTLTTSQTQTQVSNPSNLTHKTSHHSSHHDINRVTILQTTNTSQVCTPNGVNIVAISPTNIMATNAVTTTATAPANRLTPIISNNEVQILAHV